MAASSRTSSYDSDADNDVASVAIESDGSDQSLLSSPTASRRARQTQAQVSMQIPDPYIQFMVDVNAFEQQSNLVETNLIADRNRRKQLRGTVNTYSVAELLPDLSQERRQSLPTHLPIASICAESWRQVANELKADDNEASQQLLEVVSPFVASLANNTAKRPMLPGMRQKLIRDVVMVNEQAHAIANGSKVQKYICVALAVSVFVLLGVATTAALLGGALNIPGALAALTLYLAKGTVTPKVATLAAKLFLPTLSLGVLGGVCASMCFFQQSPVEQAIDNAGQQTNKFLATVSDSRVRKGVMRY